MREKFAYFKKSYDLCTAFLKRITRRDGRVVDYTGLENRRAERHRGFESLSLRKEGNPKRLPSCFVGVSHPRGGSSLRSGAGGTNPSLSAKKATRKGCLLALLRFLFLFLFFLMRVWEVLVAVADFFFPRFDGLQLVCLVVFSCPIRSESHSSVFFGFLLQR